MSSEAVSVKTGAERIWWLTVTMFALAADQFTKYWMSIRLRTGDDIDVVPGFVKFSYTENPGIAFGMLNHGNVKWFLVAISVIAIIAVVYYISRTPASNRLLLWSLALLAAGIAGNLIDRIRLGRVIDFILIYYRSYQWPVFNVADTAITIGAALMAIELFLTPHGERERIAAPVETALADAPADDQ
ncbi:MAG TPA: signal peptidase II [Blastocatellia bacterium]|nr:signal peptidase II [Blastocatellia bacterium]